MVQTYSFTIAGTEVGIADGTGPNYVLIGTSITLARNNNTGNIARVLVADSITDTVTPASGDEVIIKRADASQGGGSLLLESGDKLLLESGDEILLDFEFDYDIVFKGNIKKIEDTPNNTKEIIVLDPLQKLKYDLFVTSYDKNIDPEAGKLSAIFSDIATNGGFTPSVVDSGTLNAVDKFVSNNQSRLNRMHLIQKLLNWIFYYDYNDDVIRLEPQGYEAYGTVLNVGSQIKNIPNWEEDIEGMRNKITIDGALQRDTRTDSFDGDGNETEFELTYTPVSIETKISGTLQVLGKLGSTTGYDYTLDTLRKTIIFEVAPPSGTNNVVATYLTDIPTPVTGLSQTSIDRYGLTQAELFKFPDVLTVADAEIRLQQILEVLEFGEISTTIMTDEYGITLGNKITIADPIRTARDGDYVVTEKIINYGAEYDVLKIGTPRVDIRGLIETIDERLKALEGTDQTLTSILRSLIASVRTNVTFARQGLKLEHRAMGDSLILGHDTLGYLRTGLDKEIDCSGNSNHGTWAGTNVSTGAQFTAMTDTDDFPLNRLACGTFNGTDHNITATVSEAGIVACSFFMSVDTNSRDVMDLGNSNIISVDGSGNISTSGLTGVTTTETAVTGGTHVYMEFDSITLTNPTIGFSSTYFDGNLDEVMFFDTTLSTTVQQELRDNQFGSTSTNYTNCKLWYSFDNPKLGDRRGSYVEDFDTTY